MTRKSYYTKDKVLVNLYTELAGKSSLYVDEINKRKASAYTPFFEQQKGINGKSMLYSFKGPLELLHADIVEMRFLAKSVADLKYC